MVAFTAEILNGKLRFLCSKKGPPVFILLKIFLLCMISKMTENNMPEKTNNVLKFSDNEIKRVGFHNSKENIALFDTDIKKV